MRSGTTKERSAQAPIRWSTVNAGTSEALDGPISPLTAAGRHTITSGRHQMATAKMGQGRPTYCLTVKSGCVIVA